MGNQTWSKADNGLYLFTGLGGRQFVIYNGDGSGEVTFYRGNENIANDGGAYQLHTITTPQDGRVYAFTGGPRIRFNALTVGEPLGPLLAESTPQR